MAPAACNQRVADLTTQLQQLDDQRADLEDQRVALDLPALRTDFLHETAAAPARKPAAWIPHHTVARTAAAGRLGRKYQPCRGPPDWGPGDERSLPEEHPLGFALEC